MPLTRFNLDLFQRWWRLLDGNLLSSLRNGNMDSIKTFSRILLSSLEEQLQFKMNPNVKDLMKEFSGSYMGSETSSPSFNTGKGKRNCNHLEVFRAQENELLKLKTLFSSTKAEFANLQLQLQSDLKQMESQVEVLSMAANGYHKVVKENRTLYNMVQDLKGNIRVYCRIRPAFRTDTKNVIDYIGEDGSLVVLDPLKPHKDVFLAQVLLKRKFLLTLSH